MSLHTDITAFLSDPTVYGLPPDTPLETIETHCARVFLTGEEAWKIKKPVDFGFLDFSTFDRRYAALARELEVNRRWAGDLYRELRPITREPGGALAVNGVGEAVEWALVMRRFDQSQLLSNIAAAGEFDDAKAEALGAVVALMHAQAPIAPGDGLGGMRAHLAANTKGLRRQSAVLGADHVERLLAASEAEVARQEPLLKARTAEGFVRRCHGDLHLRNIIWREGRAVPFDALEFDEALAETDVFLDLAFLLMDCAHAGQRRAANRVLNAYLEAAKEPLEEEARGLALLPLFLSSRATTRAHVAAASAGAGGGVDEAHQYLAEAEARLQARSPRLLAIGGRSGTGKSTIARALAAEMEPSPGPVILRADALRKRLAGVSPTTRLAPEHYSAEANARVRAHLFDVARTCLAAGADVVLDTTFLDPAWRYQAEQLAVEAGAAFQGLWLDAPIDVLSERVSARSHDVSDADPTVVARQCERDEGAMSWARVDVSGTPAQALAHARAALPPDWTTTVP